MERGYAASACLVLGSTALASGFDTVIDVTSPSIGDDALFQSSTQINLLAGGAIGERLSLGSVATPAEKVELNVFGGVVGNDAGAAGDATIHAFGGLVQSGLRLNDGARLVLDGGNVRGGVRASSGSRIELNQGILGPDAIVRGEGSTFEMLGGIAQGIGVESFATASIESGVVQGTVQLSTSARLDVTGGAIEGGIDVSTDALATLRGGIVNGLVSVEQAGRVAVEGNTVANEVRIGSGGTLEVLGGTVTGGVELTSNGSLRVSGGSIAGPLVPRDHAMVQIDGGRIGDGLLAQGSSTLTLTGGSVGDNPRIINDSTFIQTGGTVGDLLGLVGNSSYVLSGGSVGEGFFARSGTRIDLLVDSLSIGGVPMPLVHGVPVAIDIRDGFELEAILLDGSPLSWTLNDVVVVGDEFFEPGSMLFVTSMPAPGGVALGFFVFACAGRRQKRGES